MSARTDKIYYVEVVSLDGKGGVCDDVRTYFETTDADVAAMVAFDLFVKFEGMDWPKRVSVETKELKQP